jgi:hypothetical protein
MPPPFYFFFMSLVLYTGVETVLKTAQKIKLALPFYFKNSILSHDLASAAFCAVVIAHLFMCTGGPHEMFHANTLYC